jgi:hypothetical protein
MVSLTVVLPSREILNVQLDELLDWMATVNELMAHALCPTVSATIVSTAVRTRLNLLVSVFVVILLFVVFFLTQIYFIVPQI